MHFQTPEELPALHQPAFHVSEIHFAKKCNTTGLAGVGAPQLHRVCGIEYSIGRWARVHGWPGILCEARILGERCREATWSLEWSMPPSSETNEISGIGIETHFRKLLRCIDGDNRRRGVGLGMRTTPKITKLSESLYQQLLVVVCRVVELGGSRRRRCVLDGRNVVAVDGVLGIRQLLVGVRDVSVIREEADFRLRHFLFA